MADPRSGAAPAAYSQARVEITAMVPAGCRRVLDVGCSVGSIGEVLRARGHTVTGIESNPVWAEAARGRLDSVIEADVEVLAAGGHPGLGGGGGPYDCVVLADVLEHLRDPWRVMAWVAGLLDPAGCVVVSVPNIRHLQLVARLLVGRRWPYDDIGIFDRTHLRWFAFANLADLVEGSGLHIVELRRSYALQAEPRTALGRGANRIAPLLGDLGTFQFVFRAERVGAERVGAAMAVAPS